MLDSITESHRECDADQEHSPVGMKEVMEVISKTKNDGGGEESVCRADKKKAAKEVGASTSDAKSEPFTLSGSPGPLRNRAHLC